MSGKEEKSDADGFIRHLPSVIRELAPDETDVLVWSHTVQTARRLVRLRVQRSVQAANDFIDSARNLLTQGETITVQVISLEDDAESLERVIAAVAQCAVGFGGQPGAMEEDQDDMAVSVLLPILFPIATSQ